MINDIFKRVKLLCWGMLLALIVGCTSEEVEGIYPDDWKYYDLTTDYNDSYDNVCDEMGDTININVKTDAKWTVSKDEDWITLSTKEGNKNGSVTIVLPENKIIAYEYRDYTREGHVTFHGVDNELTLTIRQSYASPPEYFYGDVSTDRETAEIKGVCKWGNHNSPSEFGVVYSSDQDEMRKYVEGSSLKEIPQSLSYVNTKEGDVFKLTSLESGKTYYYVFYIRPSEGGYIYMDIKGYSEIPNFKTLGDTPGKGDNGHPQQPQ